MRLARRAALAPGYDRCAPPPRPRPAQGAAPGAFLASTATRATDSLLPAVASGPVCHHPALKCRCDKCVTIDDDLSSEDAREASTGFAPPTLMPLPPGLSRAKLSWPSSCKG